MAKAISIPAKAAGHGMASRGVVFGRSPRQVRSRTLMRRAVPRAAAATVKPAIGRMRHRPTFLAIRNGRNREVGVRAARRFVRRGIDGGRGCAKHQGTFLGFIAPESPHETVWTHLTPCQRARSPDIFKPGSLNNGLRSLRTFPSLAFRSPGHGRDGGMARRCGAARL